MFSVARKEPDTLRSILRHFLSATHGSPGKQSGPSESCVSQLSRPPHDHNNRTVERKGLEERKRNTPRTSKTQVRVLYFLQLSPYEMMGEEEISRARMLCRCDARSLSKLKRTTYKANLGQQTTRPGTYYDIDGPSSLRWSAWNKEREY